MPRQSCQKPAGKRKPAADRETTARPPARPGRGGCAGPRRTPDSLRLWSNSLHISANTAHLRDVIFSPTGPQLHKETVFKRSSQDTPAEASRARRAAGSAAPRRGRAQPSTGDTSPPPRQPAAPRLPPGPGLAPPPPPRPAPGHLMALGAAPRRSKSPAPSRAEPQPVLPGRARRGRGRSAARHPPPTRPARRQPLAGRSRGQVSRRAPARCSRSAAASIRVLGGPAGRGGEFHCACSCRAQSL